MGAQTSKGTRIQFRKCSNWTNGSKIVYQFYICSSLDDRIHDRLHEQIALEMFKGKGSIVESHKEEAIINMVLIVTTQNKAMSQEDSKEKTSKTENPNKLDKRRKV